MNANGDAGGESVRTDVDPTVAAVADRYDEPVYAANATNFDAPRS